MLLSKFVWVAEVPPDFMADYTVYVDGARLPGVDKCDLGSELPLQLHPAHFSFSSSSSMRVLG